MQGEHGQDVRAQDAVLDLLKSDVKISSFVSTRQLPMIVEPRPWTDPDTGGYFDYPSFFMRVRHSIEHKEKPVSYTHLTLPTTPYV